MKTSLVLFAIAVASMSGCLQETELHDIEGPVQQSSTVLVEETSQNALKTVTSVEALVSGTVEFNIEARIHSNGAPAWESPSPGPSETDFFHGAEDYLRLYAIKEQGGEFSFVDRYYTGTCGTPAPYGAYISANGITRETNLAGAIGQGGDCSFNAGFSNGLYKVGLEAGDRLHLIGLVSNHTGRLAEAAVTTTVISSHDLRWISNTMTGDVIDSVVIDDQGATTGATTGIDGIGESSVVRQWSSHREFSSNVILEVALPNSPDIIASSSWSYEAPGHERTVARSDTSQGEASTECDSGCQEPQYWPIIALGSEGQWKLEVEEHTCSSTPESNPTDGCQLQAFWVEWFNPFQ